MYSVFCGFCFIHICFLLKTFKLHKPLFLITLINYSSILKKGLMSEIKNVELRNLNINDYQELKASMIEAYQSWPGVYWKELSTV